MTSYAGYRLLLVHAHPDDETINNGVTMAMYAKLGAQVTLITCTRGEEGEVLVGDLAHLASTHTDQLGEHRVQELEDAMKILGIKDHRFLGNFRDSGMMGTDPNKREDCFWQADLDSAAQLLVKVIEEVKPHVLITYDENGGYGHPDHIQAHRVAMRAAELAPNWKIPKIYWNGTPKSVIEQGMEKLKGTGINFFGAENIEDIPFVKDDSLITTSIDGKEFVKAKMEAMRAHATQITPDGPFFEISKHLGDDMWGHEFYSLVHGEKSGPFDSNGRETDIFSGIKLS